MDLRTRPWKIDLVTFGKNSCSDAGKSAICTNRVGNFLSVVFVASAINRPRRRCWPVGDSPGAEHGKGVVFAVVVVYPVFYQAEIFK